MASLEDVTDNDSNSISVEQWLKNFSLPPDLAASFKEEGLVTTEDIIDAFSELLVSEYDDVLRDIGIQRESHRKLLQIAISIIVSSRPKKIMMITAVKEIQFSSKRLEELRIKSLQKINSKKDEIQNDIDEKFHKIMKAAQIQQQHLKMELEQMGNEQIHLLETQINDLRRQLNQEYYNIDKRKRKRLYYGVMAKIERNVSTNIIADIDVNGFVNLLSKSKIKINPTEKKINSNEDLHSLIIDTKNDDDIFVMIGDLENAIKIKSFHVSCQSDKVKGQDMVGVVIYSYDNKIDWRLNNVHCRSGYIILKSSDNIKHIQCNQGQVHGKCYKSVFGQDIDDKVVGAGFAFFNGKWKFNSYTFNVATKYHDNKKSMHKIEQTCILAAIENWKKGMQNTNCKDILKKTHVSI
eukprot:517296_1